MNHNEWIRNLKITFFFLFVTYLSLLNDGIIIIICDIIDEKGLKFKHCNTTFQYESLMTLNHYKQIIAFPISYIWRVTCKKKWQMFENWVIGIIGWIFSNFDNFRP